MAQIDHVGTSLAPGHGLMVDIDSNVAGVPSDGLIVSDLITDDEERTAMSGCRAASAFVFIDARVEDFGTLLCGLVPGARVRLLDPARDGLDQMIDALRAEGAGTLSGIAIVAHGSPGRIEIGPYGVTAAALAAQASALAAIGAAMTPDGCVSLYCCETGAAPLGAGFVAALSKALGGRPVAASSHIVGSSSRGGSWELDVGAAVAHGSAPFDAVSRAAYAGLLVGSPPTANADTASATEDVLIARTTRATGLLSNDTAPDAGETATLIVSGAHAGTGGGTDTAVAASGTTAIAGTYGTLNLAQNGTYSYTPNNVLAQALAANALATDTFTYTARDPAGLTSSAQLTIDITGANDAPVINLNGTSAGIDNTAAYTENTRTPTVLASGLSVSDIDAGARITGAIVKITGGLIVNADRLTLRGGESGSFNDSGSQINFTFDAEAGELTLTSTPASTSTAGQYQEYLRQVGFATFSEDPGTSRTITWTVTDGSAVSATATTTVTVTPTNDAPTVAITALPGATERQRDSLKAHVTIADVDAGSGTVQVTLSVDTGKLELAVGTSGASIASGNGTASVVVTGTVAQINALLDGDATSRFDYLSIDGAPPTSATLTASVDDRGNTGGAALTASATQTIAITPVNNAPTLGGTGPAVGYIEGGSRTVVAPTLTVADPDSANLAGATVSIGGFVAGDTLSVTPQGGITGVYTASTGVLTLSGNATVAQYRDVLRSVTFYSTSDNPGSGDRTISFRATDGTDTGAAVTQVVRVTPVNDPPVISGDGAIAVLQGGSVVLTTTDLTASDVDSPIPGLTYAVSATSHGSVVVGGNAVTSFTQAQLTAGGVSFRQDGSANAAAGFTVTVGDGSLTTAAKTVSAAVDLIPVVTGIVPNTTGPTNATTLTETVTFSETVTGVDLTDFAIVNTGGASATVDSVAATGTPGVYTVGLTNVAGTGTLQLKLLNDGTVKDVAGNALTAGLTGTATVVDHTAPTITSIVPSTTGPTNAASITERVTFSEAVTGVDASDFTVTGSASATGRVGAVTAISATIYDVALTGVSGDGTLKLDLKASGTGILDAAGNLAAGYTNGIGTTLDNSGPGTPTIALARDTGISSTDCLTNDARVVVGTSEGGPVVYRVDGGASSSTYDPTPLADGRHTVSVYERDALGNGSTEAALSFTLDRTAPKLALTLVSGLSNHESGHTLAGTLNVADTGLAVTIRDGATVLGTATADSGGHFNFAFTDRKDGPSHSYALTASASDAAGNLGTSDSFVFAFDYTPNRALFGTVAHDATSHLGQVYALYEGLLDRAPDEGGAHAFVDALDHGAGLADITQTFLISAEGSPRLNAASNADFVDQIYAAVLNRASDAGGKQAWVGALENGASRADVADSFVFSAEHLGQLKGAYDAGVYLGDTSEAAVARLYHGLLDRAPDAGGLSAWGAAAHDGASLSVIAQTFIGSEEYAAVHGAQTNRQFVESLYTNGLGRADGGQGWIDQLARGASRADVAIGIVQSQEAQGHLAGQIEQGYHIA